MCLHMRSEIEEVSEFFTIAAFVGANKDFAARSWSSTLLRHREEIGGLLVVSVLHGTLSLFFLVTVTLILYGNCYQKTSGFGSKCSPYTLASKVRSTASNAMLQIAWCSGATPCCTSGGLLRREWRLHSDAIRRVDRTPQEGAPRYIGGLNAYAN